MDDIRFDLVLEDLNPMLLYAGKIDRTSSEDNYHTHDFPEIGIILEGSGTYHYNDEFVPVTAGDVLIFNPGVGHESVIYAPEERRMEFFVGFTNVQFTGMRKNHIDLRDGKTILHTQGKTRRALVRLCEEMEKENLARNPGWYFMLKSSLIQLLLTIVRDQMEPAEPVRGKEFESTDKKYVAEQIADYLEEHFAEKISLDQIAENMYLSPFYISKIFKSEIGESPIHYLIRMRMEKAKELLENNPVLPVSEVADLVGYEDVYYFSKLFKKAYGVSPSKAREGRG